MKKKNNKKKRIFKIAGIVILILLLLAITVKVEKTETPSEVIVEVSEVNIYSSYFSDFRKVEYTIEYEEGMTWEEWLDSDYNELGFYFIEDEVTFEEFIMAPNGEQVKFSYVEKLTTFSMIDNTIPYFIS